MRCSSSMISAPGSSCPTTCPFSSIHTCRWRASIAPCAPTRLDEANRILRRTGQFWQHESYDHWARDLRQSERIIAYIEENPVSAGVVQRPEDYRWSSAFGL